jgi:hypothetical protein
MSILPEGFLSYFDYFPSSSLALDPNSSLALDLDRDRFSMAFLLLSSSAILGIVYRFYLLP